MNKSTSLLLSSFLFMVCQCYGQSFVMQETNVKKNTTQCINLAKKCHMVLLKKQTLYTLAISSKSSLTANAVNMLADKFTNFFPKESAKSEGPLIERGFENPRDQIVKLTYAYMPPDKYETTDYAQVIAVFDNSGDSPTVLDIQVKNKIDLGIFRLTERDKMKFKPQPITEAKPTEKPATKPVATPATTPTAKPAAKSTTKPAVKTTPKSTAKPATTPATKSTTKPATKSTTKPATKSTTKPATKSTTKPATTPAAKKKT